MVLCIDVPLHPFDDHIQPRPNRSLNYTVHAPLPFGSCVRVLTPSRPCLHIP